MRFVVVAVFVGTKRNSSTSTPSNPLTLALSPNTEKVLGERVGICGNADPGRPQRLLPLAAPWARIQRPDRALEGGSGLLPLYKCPNSRRRYMSADESTTDCFTPSLRDWRGEMQGILNYSILWFDKGG